MVVAEGQEEFFEPPKDLSEKAWIRSMDQYREMYRRSIEDPEGFWSEMAGEFHWHKKWKKVRSFEFTDKIDIKFFQGATNLPRTGSSPTGSSRTMCASSPTC